MIQLIKHKGMGLNEIFQSLDIKMAFVNSSCEEVSAPCKCRDFLGDCIWSYKTGKVASIYGFSYNYQESPYDLGYLRLSVNFPNQKSMKNFLTNFHLLNSKCMDANTSLCRVSKTQYKNIIIIEADKSWQQSSWKLSLFTLYIKLFSYGNITELKSPEKGYITYLKPEVEDILLSKVVSENEEYLPDYIGDVHNGSGFVSVIMGTRAVEQHNIIFKGTPYALPKL